MIRKISKFVLELVLGFILVIIFVFLIRGYIVEPLTLQGIEEGGLTGIKENQYVLVDKITYHFRNPSIGELIFYKDPTTPPIRKFSRIVNVSPDKVEVRGGKWPSSANSVSVPYEFIIGRILLNPIFFYLFYLFLVFSILLFFLFIRFVYRFLSRRNPPQK